MRLLKNCVGKYLKINQYKILSSFYQSFLLLSSLSHSISPSLPLSLSLSFFLSLSSQSVLLSVDKRLTFPTFHLIRVPGLSVYMGVCFCESV